VVAAFLRPFGPFGIPSGFSNLNSDLRKGSTATADHLPPVGNDNVRLVAGRLLIVNGFYMAAQKPWEDPLVGSSSAGTVAADALTFLNNKSALVWPIVYVARLSARHLGTDSRVPPANSQVEFPGVSARVHNVKVSLWL